MKTDRPQVTFTVGAEDIGIVRVAIEDAISAREKRLAIHRQHQSDVYPELVPKCEHAIAVLADVKDQIADQEIAIHWPELVAR